MALFSISTNQPTRFRQYGSIWFRVKKQVKDLVHIWIILKDFRKNSSSSVTLDSLTSRLKAQGQGQGLRCTLHQQEENAIKNEKTGVQNLIRIGDWSMLSNKSSSVFQVSSNFVAQRLHMAFKNSNEDSWGKNYIKRFHTCGQAFSTLQPHQLYPMQPMALKIQK